MQYFSNAAWDGVYHRATENDGIQFQPYAVIQRDSSG